MFSAGNATTKQSSECGSKKPEFAEAFRKARREAFSQSIARLYPSEV